MDQQDSLAAVAARLVVRMLFSDSMLADSAAHGKKCESELVVVRSLEWLSHLAVQHWVCFGKQVWCRMV